MRRFMVNLPRSFAAPGAGDGFLLELGGRTLYVRDQHLGLWQTTLPAAP